MYSTGSSAQPRDGFNTFMKVYQTQSRRPQQLGLTLGIFRQRARNRLNSSEARRPETTSERPPEKKSRQQSQLVPTNVIRQKRGRPASARRTGKQRSSTEFRRKYTPEARLRRWKRQRGRHFRDLGIFGVDRGGEQRKCATTTSGHVRGREGKHHRNFSIPSRRINLPSTRIPSHQDGSVEHGASRPRQLSLSAKDR